MSAPLRVGDTLHGYCGGVFGRDFWGPAAVEAIGTDWVVVRAANGWQGGAFFYEGPPEALTEFREPETDDE